MSATAQTAKHPYQEFQNPETGEYTAEFEAFYQAVADAGCQNFDCNQVARAIKCGWSPQTAAASFTADFTQDQIKPDWEDALNHDLSMNA